jgi:[acyl-carrier-protein] S-malonyltransferase
MKTAFVFPGQGSQFIGMGKDLYEAFAVAREVFEQVDDALNQKLSTLMFSGDEADLNLTENTQPALMAVSMALINILRKEAGLDMHQHIAAVAGHSLGEYSAHAAVGTFSLSDTARLLKLRGQAMQKAVPVGVGSMAAILGLEMVQVHDLCRESTTASHLVVSANDNSPGQVVISGHREAVAAAMDRATAMGAKRAVLLPVSAPFHCPLMQPAGEAMREAFKDITINTPSLTVYANVTAKPITDKDQIADLLVRQVTGQVRWRETVLQLASDGFTRVVEVGAGKVLTGLNRRIADALECSAINSPNHIDEFMQSVI